MWICGRFYSPPSQIIGRRVQMPALAESLSRRLGRTVVDKTGVHGDYDIDLQWALDENQPEVTPGEPSSPPPPDGLLAPLLSSLRAQLGLTLQSAKGPVKVIVIDHVEKPSEN
jgi:uncharacterized protein (TIGR03435 family)